MTSPSPSLQTLHFEFAGSKALDAFAPVLVGVVGSGNLEVLVEPVASSTCAFDVQTSARGFDAIWEAVFRDFHERHGLAGIAVSINDMGATPAVVGLRLAQAVAQLAETRP